MRVTLHCILENCDQTLKWWTFEAWHWSKFSWKKSKPKLTWSCCQSTLLRHSCDFLYIYILVTFVCQYKPLETFSYKTRHLGHMGIPITILPFKVLPIRIQPIVCSRWPFFIHAWQEEELGLAVKLGSCCLESAAVTDWWWFVYWW